MFRVGWCSSLLGSLLLGACASSPSGSNGAREEGSSGAAEPTSTDTGTSATTTVDEGTSAANTTSSGADEDTGNSGGSSGGVEAECEDNEDCAGSTVCDVEAGVCVCDPKQGFCLGDVPEGHWVELEDSRLEDVFPRPGMVPGNPAAVVGAWSGGVYDSERNAMVLWGGGHADYAGNEVYAFDLDTTTWTRLTDPSLDVGGDEASGYYPDGLPRSRHTYDYLVFVPDFDALCSVGGAGMYMSGQITTTNFDCFDLATHEWSARAPAPIGTVAGIADYDPQSGRVAYVGGPQLRYLSQYEPASDTWTAYGDNLTNGGLGLRLTGRVDPGARLFVGVGAGAIYTWGLDMKGEILQTAVSLANPPPDFDQSNPGLAYSDALGRLVWWGRSDSLWSLDLDAMSWVEHPVAADNTVSPPQPVANGTYGRFRYVASEDVFVLVNAASDNVFVRRL